MPRTSMAALSVASVGRLPKRPSPPKDMTAREAELWRSIVDAFPAGHFMPAHLSLLRAYVGALDLHERASAEARGAPLTVRGGAGGQVVNPVFKVQDTAARLAMSLAVKLRLTPTARRERTAPPAAGGNDPARRPWESGK